MRSGVRQWAVLIALGAAGMASASRLPLPGLRSAREAVADVAVADARVVAPGEAETLALARGGTVFGDVPPDHWAAPGIGWLYLLGAIRGDGFGQFRPEEPITRAEMVRMALMARGITPGGPCTRVFPDTPCDAWYRPVAETAYRLMLVDSSPGFEPEVAMSREQAMELAVGVAGARGEAGSLGAGMVNATLAAFPDGPQVTPGFRPAVAWLLQRGIVSGRSGFLAPRAPMTRSEAALLLYRLFRGREAPAGLATVDGTPVRYRRVLDVIASKYSADEPGVGWTTATGVRVREGVVAVDPSVIPLGTWLYVAGYGYGVAADTGGAIRGNRIDLYTRNLWEARVGFGLRRLRVYLLNV